MANVLAELFQNVAGAIREKTGDTGTMKPSEFPDKIRAIEGGGGNAVLVPLSVTKNGVYRPSTINVEAGGTYTFKDSYTQDELKALYDLTPTKGEDGTATYAFLFQRNDIGTLGIASMNGFYGAYFSAGLFWLPTELASMLGSTEGWHEGQSLTTLVKMDSVPTFTFVEDGKFFVDITSLNVLFELPSADGFSSVEVKVDRESDATFEIKEFTFTAASKEQFVEWDLGYVPDITIMTSYKPPVPGSIIMFIIYNRAMLSKLPEGEGGRYKFSIDSQGLALPSNQPLLHAFEDDSDQYYYVFGHPRLATGEGFVVGVGADDDISKYGLTPGDKYVVMTINGMT